MLDIAKDLILPSGLIIICFMLGVTLIFARKQRRAAICMFGAAGMVYILFGNGPVSFWLLRNLEYKYPPLAVTDNIQKVKTIVVLSGHGWEDFHVPLSSRVNSASAFRIIEAMRLLKEIPESEILIVGGGKIPKIMRDLAISLGAPAGRISIESNSENTYENALEVQKSIGKVPFILVTSAGHMPRTMEVFQKLGMDPIPAPTHYTSVGDTYALDYLPSPLHLQCSDFAVHEYLGILWYRLRNYS